MSALVDFPTVTLGTPNPGAALLDVAALAQAPASQDMALQLGRAFLAAFQAQGGAGIPAATSAPFVVSPNAADVVAEMLAYKCGRGLTVGYLEQLACLAKRFAGWFNRPVAALRAEHVRTFLEQLPGGARSKNNYLGAIRTLVTFAQSRRYLAAGFDELRWVESYRVTPGEVEIYTPEEARALLNHTLKGRAACALQAFAGIRAAEVLRLDWEDVHLGRGFVTVPARKAKTRQRRTVPISENLAEWLRPLAKASGPVYGSKKKSYEDILRDACKRAGVLPKKNGLRHSFASYRLAVCPDENRVALEMGNSPAMIFQHYRAAVAPDTAADYWRIVPDAVPVTRAHRRALALLAAHPGSTACEMSTRLYGHGCPASGGALMAALRRLGFVAVDYGAGRSVPDYRADSPPRYFLTGRGREAMDAPAVAATPLPLERLAA